MRTSFWMATAALAASMLIAGCSNSNDSSSTSTSGSGTNGTSSSGTTGGSSASSSSASSGGSTTGSTSAGSTTGSTGGNPTPPPVNGCDPSTATDMRGQAAVTINFGGSNGLKYAPACIIVGNGTSSVQVTFSGTFSAHPLTPGTNCTADASGSNPITVTNSGTTKTFAIAPAGGVPYSVPYFCAVHCASAAMQGAIYVE